MLSRSHPEKRTPAVPREPAGVAGEGSLAAERNQLMSAALNGLAPRDREVLVRFYLNEEPQDQICALMGLTETQFRLIKARAKVRFRELGQKPLPRKQPVKAVASRAASRDFEVANVPERGEIARLLRASSKGDRSAEAQLMSLVYGELRRRDVNRVVPIVAHAVAVFGDEQKASHWLATPLALLDNRSPAQILTRGGDVEAIDQILTRIEYNIPS
jgi:hypothetical protein